MSEELLDEVVSINSIYGDTTLLLLSSDAQLYSLSLPAHPDISLRIQFPESYPQAAPSILGTQSVGTSTAKGEGTLVADVARAVLAGIHTPGVPCIFDLIEECAPRLQQLGLDVESKVAAEKESQQDVAQRSALGQDPRQDPTLHALPNGLSNTAPQSAHELSAELASRPSPPWTLSATITEKKSVFIARAASVTSVDQAKSYLAHLLATDKKVAKATHNISAWRIRGGPNGVQFQDCDDDGETAAGGRLLHLLELMQVWDGMVVVSRWYGGVLLGPDRFRIINQAARDALVTAGIAPGDEARRKGRK